jgi:hypothetical protein
LAHELRFHGVWVETDPDQRHPRGLGTPLRDVEAVILLDAERGTLSALFRFARILLLEVALIFVEERTHDPLLCCAVLIDLLRELLHLPVVEPRHESE